MGIDAEALKGDIGIELDADDVSAGDFVRALEAFVGLIREITRQTNHKLPKDAWRLVVQEGSQIVSVMPDTNKLPQAVADGVLSFIMDGMDSLEREAKLPPMFTERALESARELSKISSRQNDSAVPIRLLSREGRLSSKVTRSTFNHVSEILDWKYEDLGTVDGTLEVVSAHDGYEFRIYEPVWNRPVRCSFDQELLADALRAFKKRVEVQGMIRYTKDGIPVSAKVLKISEFPDSSELPTFRDVRGILSHQDVN